MDRLVPHSPVEVGYAKTALAIINLVQIPITPFISTTYPEINAAVTKKDWPLLRQTAEARYAYFRRLDRHYIRLGWCFSARWLLGFYGADFQPAYVPMLLFLAGLGFANIFFWNRPLLLSLGLPMVPYRISLWCGIAKIALALLLVPKLGLNFEAVLLSLFFIISVSWIILEGWKEVKKLEVSGTGEQPRMKIACITTSIIPSKSANSIQAMKVVQALKQSGQDVRLWVPEFEEIGLGKYCRYLRFEHRI